MINVAVVVPTLTNLEGGYKALHSIKGSYDIYWTPIIIDNWRTPRVLAESWNMGFEIASAYQCDYILVINDDVLFSPWTLTGLVRAWQSPKTERVAMITGRDISGQLENPEDIFNIEIPSYQEQDWVEAPDFACFMMRCDMFSKIGKFDENFIPAYFEDNDYHYRINSRGYKAISTSWAPYYHYGSMTQNKDLEENGTGVVNSIQFEANRAYYVMKWGGPPGMELFIHPYNNERMNVSQWTLYR